MRKTKKPVNRKDKLDSILLHSNNIQLLKKDGSILRCKCGICNSEFKITGYMNRHKIVCPICKRDELAERKKEKRHIKEESNYTTIKRKCSHAAYCLSTNKLLCTQCLIKAFPYYSKNEFADIVNFSNRSITVIGNYIDSQTPIEYECNVCGSRYWAKPYNLLKGVSGCKKCRQSNGERIISMYLIEHGIRYEIEKQFNDCRYKYPLRFDFYLPDYNVVIEYDGKQHFEPVRFTISQNPDDVFKEIQIRDKIKDNYCCQHSIKLIRIKYTELNINGALDCSLLPILQQN